jgi:cytochrome c biogenesis protein CcdA
VIKLLLLLLPIALLDGISPVRIATMTAFLSSRRPWVSAIAFLIGTYAAYMLLGVVIAIGADSLITFFAEEAKPIDYGAGIVIGVLLLYFGTRSLRQRSELPTRDAAEPRGPAGALFLALVLTIVTAPAALPYLAGIDLILQSERSDLEMVIALAIYCVLYVAPLVALMAVRYVLGARSAALLERIDDSVATWVPRVVAVLLILLGSLMIADGVSYFLGMPLFPS